VVLLKCVFIRLSSSSVGETRGLALFR